MRLDVDTPGGTAWIDLDRPRGAARGLLAIGHGAGGSVESPDLVAVRNALLPAGVAVARITQPYRVAGRKAPPPPARLDEAWLAAVSALRGERGLRRTPLIVAGRSSGARVACRTANGLGAVAVAALAFPLHPPGRPEKTRLDELESPHAAVLVVQGDRDAFGMPQTAAGRQVVVIPGADHSLKKAPEAVAAAVLDFVRTQLAAPA